MERDIIERLREMSGPIQPNLVTEAADTIKRLRGMVEELQVHADDLSANPTEERLMIETLTAERDEARYMLNLVIEAMRDNESAKQHLERLLAKFETEDKDWTWNDGNEDPSDEEERTARFIRRSSSPTSWHR
jgi:predicted RNase H-like nuclease (RuvC/YqgF family)